VPLKISDLVNGWNAFQFALDQGTTFWGHMIVDNACLREALVPQHPDLLKSGLGQFAADINVAALTSDPELLELSLSCSSSNLAKISSVDYQGYYTGYDENGNTLTTDWHGFTKAGQATGHLGSVTIAKVAEGTATTPRLIWNTWMLPAQKEIAARAILHFRGLTNLVYLTAASTKLEIPQRKNAAVSLFTSLDLPHPFWSRDKRKLRATIDLNIDPAKIERAELHVNAWTGGPGTVTNYFTLNGHFFSVAEGSRHELIYSQLPVDPQILKRGRNQIELLSDTEHHGVELLLPGPCLMVRFKTD